MEQRLSKRRRPNGTRPDPVRSVRISDEVWERARRRAVHEGVTMSDVMSTIVHGYAQGLVNLPRVTVSYGPSVVPSAQPDEHAGE